MRRSVSKTNFAFFRGLFERHPAVAALTPKPQQQRRSFTTFRKDGSGTTAVEFGFVALPFLMIMAAIIDVGTYYLALNALDRGIDDASRFVRTGEAQTGGVSAYTCGNAAAGGVNGQCPALDPNTVAAFKQSICEKARSAGGAFDCSKLTTIINFTNSWGGLQAADQSCTTGTSPNVVLKPSTTGSDQLTAHVSGSSAYVIITACYPWATAKVLPFIKLGNLQDGSMLLQSSTAFQTEPY